MLLGIIMIVWIKVGRHCERDCPLARILICIRGECEPPSTWCHYFLLPDCGCVVTRCLMPLLPWLPFVMYGTFKLLAKKKTNKQTKILFLPQFAFLKVYYHSNKIVTETTCGLLFYPLKQTPKRQWWHSTQKPKSQGCNTLFKFWGRKKKTDKEPHAISYFLHTSDIIVQEHNFNVLILSLT